MHEVAVVIPSFYMHNEGYQVDVPTPSERLELLLEDIKRDMKAGSLSTACAALGNIGSDSKQYAILTKSPILMTSYNSLVKQCPN